MAETDRHTSAAREKLASAIRCLILITVFAMTKLGQTERQPDYLDLLLVVGALYVLATSYPTLTNRDPKQATLLFSTLDVLLITALIAATGGASSEYYLLYYLPVLQASVRLNFRDGVGASVLAATAYLLVVVAQGPEVPVVTHSWLRAFTFGGSALMMAVFFGLMAREARAYQQLSNWYQRLSDAKSDFLATVSHEFRAPLTAIIGFSYLLMDREQRVKQKEYLEVIHGEAQRLHRMIEDMLDLSRIEAGRLELRKSEVTLPAVVQEVFALFEAHKRTHRLEMEIELETIPADRDRLFQVLANLVGNAIKYSPEGGRVLVSAARQSGEARINVCDQGPGILPEQVPALFHKFNRINTPESSGVEGTGLGLVISKAIIEMHGGRIWVESTPGEGSTFSFTIPIAAAQQAEQPEADWRPAGRMDMNAAMYTAGKSRDSGMSEGERFDL